MYFWWRWEHDACSRSGWSLLLVYQDSDCSVFASLPHSIIAVGWSSRRYQNRSDWRTEMVTKPQIMPSVVWSIYLNHHLLKHNLYRGRPTTILTFFAHLSYLIFLESWWSEAVIHPDKWCCSSTVVMTSSSEQEKLSLQQIVHEAGSWQNSTTVWIIESSTWTCFF